MDVINYSKIKKVENGVSRITEQAFKQYYRLGEEHEGVTGGYVEGHKRDDVITDGGVSKEVDHLKIAFTIEGTGTAELTLITDNMVDLTDIDTLFIDWEQLNSHPGIKSAFIVHNQRTAYNGVYTERILKSDKFNRSVDSIDVSDLVGNYYLRIHSYTTAYNLDLDLRVYNIYASGSFKAEKNYVDEEILKTKKQMLNYAYPHIIASVDGKWTPEILERQSSLRVLFRLRDDSNRITIRPENGLVNVDVPWVDIKSELEEHIVSQDGVDYLAIPESQAFVYDVSEGRFKIVSRNTGMNEKQIVLLHNNLGIVVAGDAVKWRYSKYKFDSESIPDGIIKPTHLSSEAIESIGFSVPANKKEQFDNIVFDTISREKGNSFRMVFVTDTHGEGTAFNPMIQNFNIIKKLEEYGKLDLIVHGGDFISGYLADKKVSLKNMMEGVKVLNTKTPSFILKGNHDDNSYFNTSDPQASNIITFQEWRNFVLKQIENEVVFDSQNPLSAYYYKDFDDKKLRVICLNSVDYPIVENPDGSLKWAGFNGWGFGMQQIQWLVDEAFDLTNKEGYQVLILTHAGTHADVTNVDGLIPYNSNHVNEVLKAFKNGLSYSGSSTDLGEWNGSVDCDFTLQGQNTLIAMINGHVHSDRLTTPVDLGFPVVSTIQCQTATDGAMDIFTFNMGNKEVFMDRFGDGEDRNFTY